MANPLRLLSKLRRFDSSKGVEDFLQSEFRQTLKAIEDAFRNIGAQVDAVDSRVTNLPTPATPTIPSRNFAQSTGQSSSYTESAGTFTSVTGLSVSITTTGNAVVIMLGGNSVAGGIYSRAIPSSGSSGDLRILRNGSVVLSRIDLTYPGICGSLITFDTPAAGTYTYTVEVRKTAGTGFIIEYMKLTALEII